MARLYAAARSGGPRATPQPAEGVAREQSSRDRALGPPCASRGDPARHTAPAPRPSPGEARCRILRRLSDLAHSVSITQSDVTPLMDSYRECARHLWNCYFAKDAEPEQDWNLRDDFNNLALGLFRALVLRKLRREDAKILPDHVVPRQPLLFLKLEAPVGSLIHV